MVGPSRPLLRGGRRPPGLDGTLVASAHQSHAYPDGACLYFTFAGRPAADGASGSIINAADAYYRRAWDAVMSAITAHGGALSHHHGVGLNRGRYLPRALGPAFDVLVAVKAALDPRASSTRASSACLTVRESLAVRPSLERTGHRGLSGRHEGVSVHRRALRRAG